MAFSGAGHGWPAEESCAAAEGASAARRAAEARMAGVSGERSAGHGWPKKKGSHGWRPRLTENGFQGGTGSQTAERVEWRERLPGPFERASRIGFPRPRGLFPRG